MKQGDPLAPGTPLEISIGISPRQTLSAWAELAGQLESEGVQRTWLIDSQLAMKDVYAGLNLAALHTSRMRLGPGVTNPLTRHPTVTAGAMAALAELAPGRAVLGLGAGDSSVYGLGWRPANLALVEQSLRFFAAVLQGGSGEWEGRRYQLPALEAPVPVFLAVSRPRMCRLAGQLADGAIVMGPAQPDQVAAQVGWIREGMAAAGRLASAVRILLMVTLSARPDPDVALADVRSWATAQARLLAELRELPPSLRAFHEEIRAARATYDYTEHLSVHAGHQAALSDALTTALAVAGNPEVCAQRLKGLAASGVDGFIFPLLGGGRLERLRTMRDLVLPLAAGSFGREAS